MAKRDKSRTPRLKAGMLASIVSDPALRQKIETLPAVLSQSDLSELSELARRTPDYSRAEGEALADMTDLPSGVRFAGVYLQLVRHRHLQDRDQFDALISRWRFSFPDQPAFEALTVESMANQARTIRDLERVASAARTAMLRFDGVGLRVLLCETLLDLHSRGSDVEIDPVPEVEAMINGILAEFDRVPRYWAIRSRTMAYLGRFDEARASLDQAVRFERSDANNYFARLAAYEGIRSEIRLLESVDRIESRQRSALREFDSARADLVGVLGLLAAAIAIVLVGSNIAIASKGIDGAALLLAASSAVLLLFVGYSLLPNRRPPTASIVWATALSVLGFVGSLLIFKFV